MEKSTAPKDYTSYFTFGPGAPLSPLAPSFPSKPCGKGKADLWTVFKWVVSYDYFKSEKNWKCLWKIRHFTCSYRIAVANADYIKKKRREKTRATEYLCVHGISCELQFTLLRAYFQSHFSLFSYRHTDEILILKERFKYILLTVCYKRYRINAKCK